MSTKFITKILSFVTSKFYCTDFPVPLYCRKWYYMLNANGLGLLVPHKHEIIQIFTAQVGLRAAAPIAGSKVKVCKIIPWWTAQFMLPDNIITWSIIFFVNWITKRKWINLKLLKTNTHHLLCSAWNPELNCMRAIFELSKHRCR